MPDAVGDMLQTAVRRHWLRTPSDKAKRYVDAFFDTTRIGTKIVAKVHGNHGIYTVSIHLKEQTINAACSCHTGVYLGFNTYRPSNNEVIAYLQLT